MSLFEAGIPEAYGACLLTRYSQQQLPWQLTTPTLKPPTKTGQMRATSHLLGPPKELRDKIYRHYLTVEDGFTYDPRTGKLTTDRWPLHMSLMYTCRIVVGEMSDPAINLSQRARRFASIRTCRSSLMTWMLSNCRFLVDEETTNKILNKYPGYAPVLTEWFAGELRHAFSSTQGSLTSLWSQPSQRQNFDLDFLQVLCEQHGYDLVREAATAGPGGDSANTFYKLMFVRAEPYAIPTIEDLDNLEEDILALYRVIDTDGKNLHGYTTR